MNITLETLNCSPECKTKLNKYEGMQIKPLNQNHSHESLGKEALLMQRPCSTSAASCLAGKSQVAVGETTVCILCIRSILSFLYALSIMLKALQRSELAGKTTYIASLHSALNNRVREVSYH